MDIIVTDLTRLKKNALVCLAGINLETGKCIRPFQTVPGGRTDYLSFEAAKKLKIFPGSYLSSDFIRKPGTHSPHIEDYIISNYLRSPGNATCEDFRKILDTTSHTTISAAFGIRPENKYFLTTQAPLHSLATLKLNNPSQQFQLILDTKYGPAFKATITDSDSFSMSYLKVTDLGFVDHLPRIQSIPSEAYRLNQFLRGQDTLYVRLGLGREFAPGGDESKRGYYVQVNGIYSFPTYRKDLREYV
jgi:hypothetical protein